MASKNHPQFAAGVQYMLLYRSIQERSYLRLLEYIEYFTGQQKSQQNLGISWEKKIVYLFQDDYIILYK
jgi:hypothetical protein